MSSNLPLIFDRFKYGHSLYVDGGVSDNFPIQLGDIPGKKVLGILLGGKNVKLDDDIEQNMLEYIYKLMFIPIDQSVQYKIKKASDRCKIVHISLDNSCKNIKFFNFNISSSVKLDMFTQGYEKMREHV
jgi:predicted acylesterase/phospholipase RssA